MCALGLANPVMCSAGVFAKRNACARKRVVTRSPERTVRRAPEGQVQGRAKSDRAVTVEPPLRPQRPQPLRRKWWPRPWVRRQLHREKAPEPQAVGAAGSPRLLQL